MKRFAPTLLIATLILLASCGKITSDYSFIPGNAVSVAKVELPALVEKSNMNTIRDSVNYNFIKGAMGLVGIPDIISDRSRLGIDFEKNIYFFKTDTAEDAPTVAMFWIENTDSLVNFISTIDKSAFYNDEAEIKKISFSFGVILFKDKRAYISADRNKTTTAKLTELFSLEPANSLEEKQPEVVDYLENENDFAIWADERNLMMYENPLALTNNKEAIVKKSIAALNFERGEVDMKYSEVGNEKLQKIYKLAMDKKFDEKLLLGMPKGDLKGIFSLNVKPEAHQRQMEKMNWYEQLASNNDYSEEASTSFKELMNGLEPAFSGSSIWSITEIKTIAKKEEGLLFSKSTEDIFLDWHIALELNNESLIDSVLNENATGTTGELQKGKTYFTFGGAPFPFHMAREGNKLFITNNESHMQKLMAKELTMPELDIEVIHEMEENPFFASLSPNMWSWMQNSEKQGMTEAVVSSIATNALFAVERINMRGRQTDDAALQVEIEMDLKEDRKNSLEMLITSIFEKLSFSSLKGLF